MDVEAIGHRLQAFYGCATISKVAPSATDAILEELSGLVNANKGLIPKKRYARPEPEQIDPDDAPTIIEPDSKTATE
uniref:Uncharacterized protein n=1 Tax=Acrobeloides nanus TaxID=290746 RepID=A0A914CLJ2_9BILA